MKTCIASTLIVIMTLASACAAHVPGEDVAGAEDQLGASPPIDERGNGKTFTIERGTEFKLALASNPTTGFQWRVVSTTRTLGYPSPKEGTFQAPLAEAPIGSGGKQLFTWMTASPLLQLDATAHAVTLEYRRAADSASAPAAKTFSFKLIIKGSLAPPPPPITLYAPDNGATVTAAEGQDVAVRLPQNVSTGFAWFVESVDRTLGQPAKTVEAPTNGPPGSGAVAVFSWKTSGPLSMVGSHRITLKYTRGATDTATQQFSFTMNIVTASPSGGFACPPAAVATIDCRPPATSPYCGSDYRWFATASCNVTYLR